MKIDTNKITSSPKNQYEAVTSMIGAEQKLIDAIFILQSVIDNPDDMDLIEPRIITFLKQFEKIESI